MLNTSRDVVYSSKTTLTNGPPPPMPWLPIEGENKRSHPRPPSATDLARLYPDAIAASSNVFGWQNVRAFHLRYHRESLEVPAEGRHCLVVNLGGPVQVSTWFRKQNSVGEMRIGEVTIIPAEASWCARSPAGATSSLLLLFLRPLFVREAAADLDFSYAEIAITPQIGISNRHIRHMALSLLHELNEASVLSRPYADSLATGLAMQLVQHYNAHRTFHQVHGGVAPHKLRKALNLIDRHLAQELDGRVPLQTVAKEVGMSYFHFSRAFKQSMGMSPTNYIAERRISRAKELLQGTGLPIAEIALRAGFSSQSHFTSSFRRLAGSTPKDFRASI